MRARKKKKVHQTCMHNNNNKQTRAEPIGVGGWTNKYLTHAMRCREVFEHVRAAETLCVHQWGRNQTPVSQTVKSIEASVSLRPPRVKKKATNSHAHTQGTSCIHWCVGHNSKNLYVDNGGGGGQRKV